MNLWERVLPVDIGAAITDARAEAALHEEIELTTEQVRVGLVHERPVRELKALQAYRRHLRDRIRDRRRARGDNAVS